MPIEMLKLPLTVREGFCRNMQFSWRPEGVGEEFGWDGFLNSCAKQLEAIDEQAVDTALKWLAPIVAAIESELGQIRTIDGSQGSRHKPFETPTIDKWVAACIAAAQEKSAE